MKYLKLFFSNYANFSGRTSRKTYWVTCLILVLFQMLLWLFGTIIGGLFSDGSDGVLITLVVSYILIAIFGLGLFIPSLSIMVRRLHDVNKSGFWYFIVFVPVIGSIWLLVLFLMPGTSGANDYGELFENL